MTINLGPLDGNRMPPCSRSTPRSMPFLENLDRQNLRSTDVSVGRFHGFDWSFPGPRPMLRAGL